MSHLIAECVSLFYGTTSFQYNDYGGRSWERKCDSPLVMPRRKKRKWMRAFPLKYEMNSLYYQNRQVCAVNIFLMHIYSSLCEACYYDNMNRLLCLSMCLCACHDDQHGNYGTLIIITAKHPLAHEMMMMMMSSLPSSLFNGRASFFRLRWDAEFFFKCVCECV